LQVTQAADSFINAFVIACSTQFKSQISQKVHPDTIRTALSSVNLNDVLGFEQVHAVFKQCYGIRTWLSAPEEGVRGVLRATLQLYEAPLRQILVEMHEITLEAAKLAMKNSIKADSRAQGRKSLIADDTTRSLLLDQAENLVEQWRDETWDQIRRNIHAEAEFPAPERFSKLKSRLADLLGAEAAQQAARQNEVYKRMLLDTLQQLQNTNPAKPLGYPSSSTKTAAPAAVKKEEPPSWSEYFMGWLMKQNRHGIFQRRWFALSIRQQKFWYFANPEEQPARGAGDLVGAKIINSLKEEDGDEENSQQKTFRIVFRGGDAPIIASRSLSIPPEAQKAAEALTGQKTKTLTMELTLRASTVDSKNQWCEMLNKAILGVSEVPTKIEAAVESSGAGNSVSTAGQQVPNLFVEDNDESFHVGRKISTKIFKEESSTSTARTAAFHKSKEIIETKAVAISVSSSNDEDDTSSPSAEEEAILEREMALFNEISAQAEYTATEDEQAVLECVSLAVREYIVDALGYLTEQASRIIADGMLPTSKVEELHSKLLRVLITGREGGGSGWAAAKGGFDSETEA
jgi:hypothetical protein